MNRGKRISRRNLISPRWALERLEDRTLLSGNVTATVTSAGNLQVVGDFKDNQIVIQSTPSGALQVSSLDGTTTINGGSSPFSTTAVTGDVDVLHRSDQFSRDWIAQYAGCFKHRLRIMRKSIHACMDDGGNGARHPQVT